MHETVFPLCVALRQELHAHPELSGQEAWTKRRLMDFLRTHTALELVDRGNWFYAVYRGGSNRPGIAFRADMDAVAIKEILPLPYASGAPGVSHKCGHDGHCAALCALAILVERQHADRDVYFLFQHAEENGAGAIVCRVLMKEAGIGEIYAFHNMPGQPLHSVAVTDGVMNCASEGMTIIFQGAPAHASRPEDGRNPAAAVAEIILAIPDLLDPNRYRGLVQCTVVHTLIGMENFGISAADARLSLTCRSHYEEELTRLKEALAALALEKAQRDGLEVSFHNRDAYPETSNHALCASKIRRAAGKLGLACMDLDEPFRASEDYGHYLKEIPGAIFFLGAGEETPMLHTPDYDFPDALLQTAVSMFLAILEQ